MVIYFLVNSTLSQAVAVMCKVRRPAYKETGSS